MCRLTVAVIHVHSVTCLWGDLKNHCTVTRLLTTDEIKELWLEEGGAYKPEEEEPTHCPDTNTLVQRPFCYHLFLETTTDEPQRPVTIRKTKGLTRTHTRILIALKQCSKKVTLNSHVLISYIVQYTPMSKNIVCTSTCK